MSGPVGTRHFAARQRKNAKKDEFELKVIAGPCGSPPKIAEMRTATDIRLEPDGPPLRRTAKARPFRSEITRLYLEGHTFAAIRNSLTKVGVHVSESTVRRELTRPRPRQCEAAAANPIAGQEVSPKASPPHLLLASDRRTGKEIAEDFVKGRITNPLLRSRGPT